MRNRAYGHYGSQNVAWAAEKRSLIKKKTQSVREDEESGDNQQISDHHHLLLLKPQAAKNPLKGF
jgi:hypothetical protein